jgi:integrase/recombinase XerC
VGTFDLLDQRKPSSAASAEALSLTQVIESYLRYYAAGDGHTARAKRLDLKHFITFLAHLHGFAKAEKLRVAHWDYSAVKQFIEQCLAKGEAPATVSRRLATLKHMGRTLAERMPGFVNPAREVKAPRADNPVPKALSRREVESVRTRAVARTREKNSFIRIRNTTLFNLLLDTGLRADEVRLLKFGQLDPSLEWLEGVRTKGRRFRNVYITSEMRKELAEYIKVREETLLKFYQKLSRGDNRALPLFVSTYSAVPGKPETFIMGAKTLWRAVNELSASVHLHPHLLRHSFALDLLEDSSDIRLVSQALGHSDVRITMRYTERHDREIAAALERSRKRRKQEDT